jgi:dCMP deaminase
MGSVRPTWDEYFLQIAWAVSMRGDCMRSQVGAVIVDEYNRVQSVGYNGSEPGGPSCLAGECPRCLSDVPSGTNYEDCVELHAEDNALRNLYYRGIIDVTVYITREPCNDCWGKLIHAFDVRVVRVVWPTGEFVNKLED